MNIAWQGGQMTVAELRRAIEEPAQRGGWEFEPGLVDALMQDIGGQGVGGFQGRPGVAEGQGRVGEERFADDACRVGVYEADGLFAD